MTNKELQILFTDFLKKKDLWTEYYSNVLSVSDGDLLYFSHDRDLNIIFTWDPLLWICEAFDWELIENTDWWKINGEWTDLLRKKRC